MAALAALLNNGVVLVSVTASRSCVDAFHDCALARTVHASKPLPPPLKPGPVTYKPLLAAVAPPSCHESYINTSVVVLRNGEVINLHALRAAGAPMKRSTVTLPEIVFPEFEPLLVISAIRAVEVEVETMIKFPLVVRVLLLVPKLSVPVIFNNPVKLVLLLITKF